jgi:hypothetical protein
MSEMIEDLVAHRQIRRLRPKDTSEPAYKEHIARWEDRWKRDLSGLWIPERQEGFDRLLVIPQGLRNSQAYDRLGTLGITTWRYQENQDTIFNARVPNQDYAVWVRDRQEADEEHQNKSYNDCVLAMLNGITLLERLVFEEDWWLQHKSHLDESNATLCSGSRYADGHVPRVLWYDGEVRVRWSYVNRASPCLRLREEVS